MWAMTITLVLVTVLQLFFGGFILPIVFSIIARFMFLYNFLGRKPDMVTVGAMEGLGVVMYPFYCFISAKAPDWKLLFAYTIGCGICYYIQYYNDKNYTIVIMDKSIEDMEDKDDE